MKQNDLWIDIAAPRQPIRSAQRELIVSPKIKVDRWRFNV
jgi:hypothetical protein